MKPPTRLRIFLLYYSDQGRESNFYNLVHNSSALDSEHYEPKAFRQMQGGLEMVVDEYYTIFHDFHFYILAKATDFLIHSLYWLRGQQNDWFTLDEEYPQDVVCRMTDGNLLRLCKGENETVVLSFLPLDKNHQPTRMDRFFEGITFRREDWFEAARQGLSEYFDLLLDVTGGFPNDPSSMLLMEYYDVWRNIEG